MSAGGKLAPGRHAPILFRFMSFPLVVVLEVVNG